MRNVVTHSESRLPVRMQTDLCYGGIVKFVCDVPIRPAICRPVHKELTKKICDGLVRNEHERRHTVSAVLRLARHKERCAFAMKPFLDPLAAEPAFLFIFFWTCSTVIPRAVSTEAHGHEVSKLLHKIGCTGACVPGASTSVLVAAAMAQATPWWWLQATHRRQDREQATPHGTRDHKHRAASPATEALTKVALEPRAERIGLLITAVREFGI